MKVLAEQEVCIGRTVQTLEIMSSDENEVYRAWHEIRSSWIRKSGSEGPKKEESR